MLTKKLKAAHDTKGESVPSQFLDAVDNLPTPCIAVKKAGSGETLDLDLQKCIKIGQVRSRVAEALDVFPARIQLLAGDTLLVDELLVEDLCDRNLTALVVAAAGPHWLPAGKYLHEGKDVVRITGFADFGGELICHIHYADGTKKLMAETDSKHSWDRLVGEFGFVEHKTEDFEHDQIADEDYTCWEAVPTEDPDQWEAYSRTEVAGGYGDNGGTYTGERRKLKDPVMPIKKLAAVGTMNPGKHEACRLCFAKWQAVDFTIVGTSVDSGVPDQPMGLEETMQGAKNRAKAALEAVEGASIGIGLESGVVVVEGVYFDCCSCAIFDGKRFCVGMSSMFALPPRVAAALKEKGYNPAFEAVGMQPDPNGAGVLGVMSKGVLSRPSQMKESVHNALLQLVNPDLYP